MSAKIVLEYANIAICLGCFSILATIVRKGASRTYPFLIALLAVRGLMATITVALLFHRRELGISLPHSYFTYFYAYWTSAVLQLILQVLVIYGVYRIAMKPLDGLKRIGSVIFRWVASVSVALSLVVALGPHVQGSQYAATLLGQAQQGVCVMTVCLLLFVCFAARPLGLTFRSRAFGVALGLGLSSTASLVIGAWLPTSQALSLYSPVFAISSSLSVLTLMVWGSYFALPETKRKLVLLPTTSPYFLWNRISEALGDQAGDVAVAGFTPDMLAPAELRALTAFASLPQQPHAVPSAIDTPALAASF